MPQRSPRSPRPSSRVAVVLAAAIAPSVAAAPPGEVREGPVVRSDGTVVLETAGDPPAVAMPDGRSERAVVVFGDYRSVQVNVNGGGMNVVGDAANEPSIAIDPTAPLRMAVGWRQFDTIASSFRQAGYSWSVDGGATWAPSGIIEPGVFRSDPVLVAGVDGTFYYLSLRVDGSDFSCDLFVSSDQGRTWPIERFALGGDKAWLAIDRTGGIGTGHLYQPWNIAGNPYFPNLFSRSVNAGVLWLDPIMYDPDGDPFEQPVFGQAGVGPEGEVYVAGARNSTSTDRFWVVKSSNARNPIGVPTFEQFVQVDMGGENRLGAEPNPAGLAGQVEVDVDRSDGPCGGRVYVVASIDPPGPDPMDVVLAWSADGGLTWSDPVRVNDDAAGNWQWFGTLSVAPNGRVDVIWNDTRNGGAANRCQVFRSSSFDGGVTFEPSEPMTPIFDSHLGWPQQDKLGDYYQLLSDRTGADLIYAATFNGEQDVYHLRIGPPDCNGNGVGDGEDVAAGTSGDCNGNGLPDECEIAAGTAEDLDGDGVPDRCADACPDLDGDGSVATTDLLELLAAWGPCAGCPADLDGDGAVGTVDLLALLAAWGPCPG